MIVRPRTTSSRRIAILGIVLVAIAAGLSAVPVSAGVQSRAQRACLTRLNAAGARVANATAKGLRACVRRSLSGKLPPGVTAEQCLTVESEKRVARARNRTTATEKKCKALPDFGARSAAEVNAAFEARPQPYGVFGPDLDAALAVGRNSKRVGRCQLAVVKHMWAVLVGRLRAFNACARAGLKKGVVVDEESLAECYGGSSLKMAKRVAKLAAKALARCSRVDLSAAIPGECAGESADVLSSCVTRLMDCDASLAVIAADGISVLRPHRFVDGVATAYCGDRPPTDQSVARQWNEEILDAIRIDFPRPPIHARNLLHLSIAMWDAWAAYDDTADGYLVTEKHTFVDSAETQAAREAAISFAAYRILLSRYGLSPNALTSAAAFRARMNRLGYDPGFTSTEGDSPAALGNRIAAAVLDYGATDGSGQESNYADPTYAPVNDPLIVKAVGTTMKDPNRWQPLALDSQIGQNGLPIPGNVQVFVGSQWGSVTPFAIDFASALPGPPPLLHDTDTDDEFKAQAIEVIDYSSLLSPDDPTLIDISPASLGNNTLGANDGAGYSMNPVTGQPYAPQLVKRADFGRVIAEFWADGPTSETPPGHWNTIANYVVDHPLFERRFQGTGPVLDPLEWDVKAYLAVNGAVHDAAVAAWGSKRFYDSVRPISMIRYMGGLGQSSNPSGPSYDPDGLPIIPGLVEVITSASSAPGERHAALADHVGEIAVLSWPGEPPDPATQWSGVRWIRAVEWVAYQRSTFVTPPFAGYVSGHSTFSRAAAEVLTRITGSEYFPGGLGEFTAPQDAYLVFEVGPSDTVVLQWATYYDASDQAGQSRLWGGIHIRADDFEGRKLGALIGAEVFDKAVTYFDGTAVP